MWYVYILKSNKDNRTYLGSTNRIDKRFEEHRKGYVKSTKNRRPLKLIYYEKCNSEKEARLKEKYFKTGAGRTKLKKILSNKI
ncbi:MAG: GIY-YIG nuclease family protein [Elusimicrobia bacterium]|nr:GIY-YIG nuclease family protein [Elusimicrobiota bacterium]